MLYYYEAVDKSGYLSKGEVEASSKKAVYEQLEKKGLVPVNIEKRGEAEKLLGGRGLSLVLFETVTALDRIVLVRNLAATIKAGLNIIEALDILIRDASKSIIKKILTKAKTDLQNGKPLSSTFAYFGKYFPPVFVGVLRAGEASGRLGHSLDELNHNLNREYNLSRKVKSTLAYPTILLIASIAVIILLLVFVIPRLTKLFTQSKASLPVITKILIALSNVVTYSLFLDIVVAGFLAWVFIYFRKTDFGRKFFLKIVYRIPVAKELVKKVALVRFSRTLGSLIASGTPILEALRLSAESAGNEYYKAAILEASEKMKSGTALSKTLAAKPDLFPSFLVSLIGVGERTATLENILRTFADFYDEEVDNSLRDLMTFLEPLLLLFMGLVVGSIAFSILLPIYRLVGKFV